MIDSTTNISTGIKSKGQANDKNRLDLVIMPTLECNFACVYCYENSKKGIMTLNSEEIIKKWLANNVPKYKFVMLHWYGGEPLLGLNRILTITQFFQKIAQANNIEYSLHITTNGYLLTHENLKKLNSIGIYDFQITVDGSRQYHNKLRKLKNGAGTFDRLYENIVGALNTSVRNKITLRVNFNHANIHSIPELLHYFPDNIRNRLRVIYEPIFGSCSISAISNIPTNEMSEKMASYYKLAEQLGYDVVLSQASVYTGKLVYCYAERENQIIINYNLDLYKCSVSDFAPEQRVGYLDGEGKVVKNTHEWEKWVGGNLFDDQCYNCLYLPLCMGGCRKNRLRKNDNETPCSLIPTNASYVLKQIALDSFPEIFRKELLSSDNNLKLKGGE